jgi:hypothetical protein
MNPILLTYRSEFGLFTAARTVALCVTLCCRTRPFNPTVTHTDIQSISTAGGIERSASDIRVSSHYESCHIICVT